MPGLTERECEDASNFYILTLVTAMVGLPFPIINLIACIIYWLNSRSKSPFVRFHAFQSVTSQIPIIIMNSVGLTWTLRIIFSDVPFSKLYIGYIITIIIFNLIDYVYNIIAAIKARKGIIYRYAFFGDIAFNMFLADDINKENGKDIL